MQERFCFWTFDDWRLALETIGFKINSRSRAYRNDWIVESRWQDKVGLFEEVNGELTPLEYPVTTMMIVAEKSVACMVQ